MKNKYIGIKEMAEILDSSKGRLYSAVKNNEIPHLKFGRKYLFSVEEVEKFLQESTIHALIGGVGVSSNR